MEYVAGSHKWQKFYAPEAFNSDSRFNDLDIQRVPDIDGNRDDYRILQLGSSTWGLPRSSRHDGSWLPLKITLILSGEA